MTAGTTAIIRIVFAALMGLALGYISGFRNVRIFVLIAAGSTLLTIVSVEFFRPLALPLMADPGRIAAQIIVALGFLGTGLIWISEDSKVKGLPVAGSLLVTAIIGILIGIGNSARILAVVFLLLLFYLLSYAEWKIRSKTEQKL